MKTVDVGAVLDEGRWTGYQKLLVFGTALTIILDGVDNQLLPNTVPTLIKEWGQPRPALVTSVIAFAVLTIAISYVNTIDMLLVLRFLAGVGLGGAMPNAATLASEHVPLLQTPARGEH